MRVCLGLFRVGLGFVWSKIPIFSFFKGLLRVALVSWGLVQDGRFSRVYLYCAASGLFRLEKQKSRKQQGSRTVKKQRSKETERKQEARKGRQAEKQTAEKQGNEEKQKSKSKQQ